MRVRCVALLALVPCLLGAQGPRAGAIAGRVMLHADTGTAAPAVGAIVSLLGRVEGTLADTGGRFLLAGVPAGSHTVRVRLPGYRALDRRVRVIGGDTVQMALVLETDAQRLSAIRTTARAAEAERFVSRPDVGTIAMSARALSGVPSVGEPDVLRTVRLLAGVASRNDYNASLNVRGGEGDQNLVLLDGYPIYNPFHLGGLFSTFMDATVAGIELMTAAFPARYGDRLSSVLDVRSAEDDRASLHGSADLSVLATSGRLAGGFADGRGTWSVAGRRTYADALASLFTTNAFPYHFGDFHGHVSYDLSSTLSVALTAYAGRDALDANLAEFESDSAPARSGQGRWAFNWGNSVVGLTIRKSLGDSVTLEQRLSTSGFSTQLDVGSGALSQRSEIRDLRASGSVRARGGAHDRALGYEVASTRIRYASGSPSTQTSTFDIAQQPVNAALWADDLWRLSSRWLVEGGLRAEAQSSRRWAGLSPRISLKYFATPDLALTAGAGRVTQSLHSLAGDGPLRYFDIWIASDSFIPVSTAWHYALGAERRVSEAGSVRVEGYVKRYDRLQEVNRADDPRVRGDEFRSATGLTYGADLLARWQSATGLAGWLSYSYGVSSRWSDTLRWAPGHDRRHDVNLVATWRLSKYRVGARFGYASGTPYTPIVGGVTRRVYDPSLDHWGTGDPLIYIESIGGAHNSARYPATHRLDLDVSREYLVRGATVAPYLSVMNAYNARNVFVYLYQYSTDLPTRRAISQFPILPSAGVRVAF